MNELTGVPTHLLLSRKDDAASHSTRKLQEGAASAFASYGFGPVEEDSGKKDGASPAAPITGASPAANPINAPTLAWLTKLSSEK